MSGFPVFGERFAGRFGGTFGTGGGGSIPPVVFLVRDDFPLDEAATMVSPRNADPGPGILTSIGDAGYSSISSGILKITNSPSRTCFWRSANIDRLTGRAFFLKMAVVSGSNCGPEFGMLNTSNTIIVNVSPRSLNDFLGYDGLAKFVDLGNSLPLSTTAYVIVLDTAGQKFYAQLSGLWELVWVDRVLTTTPIRFAFWSWTGDGSAHVISNDYFYVRDLDAPFTTDYGTATFTDTTLLDADSFTGTADCIIDFDFTLPASPSAGDVIGYHYRQQDANNYWFVKLVRNVGNTAWDCQLRKVLAGVESTPAGWTDVTGVSTPAALRVITKGSLHDVFTLAATTWTKRGNQVNVSHMNTQTGIVLAAAAGTTLTRLTSYPKNATLYETELNKT